MAVRLRLACLAAVTLAGGLASIGHSTTTSAGPAPCLSGTATGDGDTLTLAAPIEGTSTVRLAGVFVPPPPTETGAPASRFAVAARDALSGLIAGRCLALVPDLPLIDRYNRLYAHVYRDDGVWVQGELVSQGLVMVLPGLDEPERIRRMLPLEAAARAAQRGVWGNNGYATRLPEEAYKYVGTVQLVEGTVLKTARVGPRVYLNFGEEWQTDFTVVVPAKALATWQRAGADPLQLSGRKIRVRGVIEMLNGPMIEAPDPEMVEVLDGQD